jgi:hypothetical protein
MAAWMSDAEIECARRYMRQSKVYLEFGCGGSTQLAAEAGVSLLFSVDSNKDWVKRCRKQPWIAAMVASGRATLVPVKVGPLGRLGFPADESQRARWPNYSLAIWEKMGNTLPDTVLIDGRWRVSTAVQSLLRCPAETIMMFHDYYTPRLSYWRIQPFIEIVETVDTMLVYRAKPDMDVRALAALGCATLLQPH